MDNVPDITPLQQGAAAMHELYKTFVQEGFTPDQAIQLIIGIFRPNFGGN